MTFYPNHPAYIHPDLSIASHLRSHGHTVIIVGVGEVDESQDSFVKLSRTSTDYAHRGVIRQCSYIAYIYTRKDSGPELSYGTAEEVRLSVESVPSGVDTAAAVSVIRGPLVGDPAHEGYYCQELEFDVLYRLKNNTGEQHE